MLINADSLETKFPLVLDSTVERFAQLVPVSGLGVEGLFGVAVERVSIEPSTSYTGRVLVVAKDGRVDAELSLSATSAFSLQAPTRGGHEHEYCWLSRSAGTIDVLGEHLESSGDEYHLTCAAPR